ncbi:MAG: S1 RNA-binding domain-containing protein [Proteobacteria bacterium]|nr:S1 RNA-binding domain-containing protein [Pseudomonadota bacterium]
MDNEKFEDLLNHSLFMKKEGLVKGIIVKKLNDGVLINLGIKTDKFIPKTEFLDDEWDRLSINDEIEVVLRGGNVSYKEARKSIALEEISQAYKSQSPISIVIKSETKGGYTADYKGFQIFVPGSQAKGKKDIQSGDTFFAFIKKFEEGDNNIVCSISEYESYMKNKTLENFFSNYKTGDVLEGEVKNIIDKGVFVNIEGVEGFIPFSEITHRRIKSPGEFFSIGQKIKVKIIRLDKENNRIVISTKALEQDPFQVFTGKYKEGDKIDGIVRNIIDKGVFVEIMDGLDGFLPLSEISWTERVKNPDKYFKIGDKVSVIIKKIDTKDKKISLSFKDLLNNPWDEFKDKNPVGSVVNAVIKDIVEKGLVVNTDYNLEAFIPNENIGYGRLSEEKKNYKKGDKIEAKVIEIDSSRRRIILSIKEMLDDPFNIAMANIKIGDEVKGKISGFTENVVFFEIMPKVEGIVKRREFKKEDSIKIGDSYSLLVTDIDDKKRKFVLSIEELKKINEKRELEDHKQKNKVNVTLGDFFKK